MEVVHDADADVVRVSFADGHSAALPVAWLAFQAQRDAFPDVRHRPLFLWQNEETFAMDSGKPMLPVVRYDANMSREDVCAPPPWDMWRRRQGLRETGRGGTG